MRKIYYVLTLLVMVATSNIAEGQSDMDNGQMLKILEEMVDTIGGNEGNWQIVFGEHLLFVITDEVNNRMRIFSPITEEKDLKDGEMATMLEANFHAALDVKYALFNGLVISLFTHPLKELTSEQFKDALTQVATANQTFGTTYSSTDLIFGGGLREDGESEKDKKVNQKTKKKT